MLEGAGEGDETARLRVLRQGLYGLTSGGEEEGGAGVGGVEGLEEELAALSVIYGEGEEEGGGIDLTPLEGGEGDGGEWRPSHRLGITGMGLPPGHRLWVWLSPSYPHARQEEGAPPACVALLEGEGATPGVQVSLSVTSVCRSPNTTRATLH